MEDGAGAEVVLALGDLGAEDKHLFAPSDGARVLHRAPVEVNYCNLVVLLKRIGKAKDLFKVIKTLFSYFENIFGINMLKE